MSDEYYKKTLYPLQDQVLSVVSRLPVDFYLTGGTALGRTYLHHRYSDDLDFFLNGSQVFKAQVQSVLAALGDHSLHFETGAVTDTFLRIFLRAKDITMKVDFVNDVPYHAGPINSGDLFPRLDNPMNILSNKICALTRLESKDIADILYISYCFSFDWRDILEDARKKDLWANPVDASRILHDYSVSQFEPIKWIQPVDMVRAQRDLQLISKDILLGSRNSVKQGET